MAGFAHPGNWLFGMLLAWNFSAQATLGFAQELASAGSPYAPLPTFDALTTDEWKKVDQSVARGLHWLSEQQEEDGSFGNNLAGQPAITSLVVMAFLSRGYRPGHGPHGALLNRAIDYALACQQPDGMFLRDTEGLRLLDESNRGAHTGLYNHAITGLMLGEAYGMTDEKREERMREAIGKALGLARTYQKRPSPHPNDSGGFRYVKLINRMDKGEADLSVTGWFVMFFRSARNAEFDVPENYMTEAMQFVRKCYVPEAGGFVYGPYRDDYHVGRGMTGAGLLCLTISGERDDEIARRAGQWILDHPFSQYGVGAGDTDRFHYGAYYCSQGMFLLGGDYWKEFFPIMAQSLIANQKPEGQWSPDLMDRHFRTSYSTAFSILALTMPYQLLPIYQR